MEIVLVQMSFVVVDQGSKERVILLSSPEGNTEFQKVAGFYHGFWFQAPVIVAVE